MPPFRVVLRLGTPAQNLAALHLDGVHGLKIEIASGGCVSRTRDAAGVTPPRDASKNIKPPEPLTHRG
jgi:hypothetical protein